MNSDPQEHPFLKNSIEARIETVASVCLFACTPQRPNVWRKGRINNALHCTLIKWHRSATRTLAPDYFLSLLPVGRRPFGGLRSENVEGGAGISFYLCSSRPLYGRIVWTACINSQHYSSSRAAVHLSQGCISRKLPLPLPLPPFHTLTLSYRTISFYCSSVISMK